MTPEADKAARELLPCPFCGGEDEPGKRFGIGFHQMRDANWIVCAHCFAEGPMIEPSDNDRAIAAWNKRTGSGEKETPK